MLLVPPLKDALETVWLDNAAGAFPPLPLVSGQRFALALTPWFATAQALGFPCTTALARQGQLATQAAAALSAGVPAAAGMQLALAVAGYYAGQNFGSGVAGFPLATSAVAPALGAVFADTAMSQEDRAEQVAAACHALALSTIVVFAAPPAASPIF
jgi:hypothetical protein